MYRESIDYTLRTGLLGIDVGAKDNAADDEPVGCLGALFCPPHYLSPFSQLYTGQTCRRNLEILCVCWSAGLSGSQPTKQLTVSAPRPGSLMREPVGIRN